MLRVASIDVVCNVSYDMLGILGSFTSSFIFTVSNVSSTALIYEMKLLLDCCSRAVYVVSVENGVVYFTTGL